MADYKARLEQLNSKLEREGLTDNERAEVGLIYSMALLAWRDKLQAIEK